MGEVLDVGGLSAEMGLPAALRTRLLRYRVGLGFGGDGDVCLSIFGEVWATGALVFPQDAAVLEIGCAEADWMTLMLAQRPDLRMTGIDWRDSGHRPVPVIQGDVLTHEFPDASFDAVIGISSIEHIGLGHYDNDPKDVDGDLHCMQRAVRWLKPGGWVYADVPYATQFHVCGTSHRAYDVPSIGSRLTPGLIIEKLWWYDGARRLAETPPRSEKNCEYIAVLARKESA